MSLPKLFAECEKFLALHKVPLDHGWQHALAVARNASAASLEEDLTMAQTECIMAAAVLHDVDDRKFFPATLDSAGLPVSLPNARRLLDTAGYGGADRLLILEMIGLVSASTAGNSVVEPRWKLIPRDADRVEALGVIGIERCYAYTQAQKRTVALADTPAPVDDEGLAALGIDERFRQYVATKGSSRSMIDHFYDKLLAMTLESRNGHLMAIATERTNTMKEWLFKVNQRRISNESLAMDDLPSDLRIW